MWHMPPTQSNNPFILVNPGFKTLSNSSIRQNVVKQPASRRSSVKSFLFMSLLAGSIGFMSLYAQASLTTATSDNEPVAVDQAQEEPALNLLDYPTASSKDVHLNRQQLATLIPQAPTLTIEPMQFEDETPVQPSPVIKKLPAKPAAPAMITPASPTASAKQAVQAAFRLFRPVQALQINSPFGMRHGRRHNGVDFGGHLGDAIYAAGEGKVIKAGWESGYGKRVVIAHPNGMQTLYSHCSTLTVGVGKNVKKGDLVGKMGMTGHATGPHLHFEVIVNGTPKNPMRYIASSIAANQG